MGAATLKKGVQRGGRTEDVEGHGGASDALRAKRYSFLSSVALGVLRSSSVLKTLRCHQSAQVQPEDP